MTKKEGVWNKCLHYAAASDVGLRRANNQDAFSVMIAGSREQFASHGHVFVVADGMGAHAAGELASKIAADVIPLNYYKSHDDSPADALKQAVHDAHIQVHAKGQSDESFRGMGTTVDAMVLLPEGALVAHVGDSRVYRLRAGVIEQLTFDHSLVWELRAAGEFPDGIVPSYVPKNVITRSLGPNPDIDIDIEGPFALEVGDSFLLCSDGLSGQVADEEIGQILMTLPPKDAVEALINLANLRGGPDNITVSIASVTAPINVPPAAGHVRVTPPSSSLMSPTIIWLLASIAVVIGGLFTVLGNIPAAVIGAVAAAILIAVAMALRFGEESAGELMPNSMLGRGPHARADARPNAAFVASLSKIVRELREAGEADQWKIDWAAFDKFEKNAAMSAEQSQYDVAVRDYAAAISHMMDDLKRQRR